MNRSNATLIVVGLVGAVSVVIGALGLQFVQESRKTCRQNPCPGPDAGDHAKYILCFGDCEANPASVGRISVDSPAGFQDALNKVTTRVNTLQEVDKEGEPSYAIGPKPVGVQDTTIAYLHIIQRDKSGNPATMHVTQKIGLDSMTDVNAVLAHIQQPQ